MLIRLGLSPFAAGYALSVTWTVLLIGGIFTFLRRAGAGWPLAAAGALLPMATAATYNGLADIRGDVLPAALNLWGLALCLPRQTPAAQPDPNPVFAPVWPAILFVLAFAAKITTIFGAVAAVAALLLNGRRKEASRLALPTVIGYALVLAGIYFATGGRIVEIFRACAAGGGGIKYFVQSPVWMTSHYLAQDPIGFVLFVLAFGGLVGLLATNGTWRELPSIALLSTLAMTLFIFGSPGTSFNHFIDLDVIAVIFLLVQAIRRRLPGGFMLSVLSGIAIVAAVQHLDAYRDAAADSRRREMVRAVAAAGDPAAGPILAEDPLIPLVAGARPYVLDSWMLRLIADKNPAVMQRLASELRDHKFRAVVLLYDPMTAGGKFLEARVFGTGFVKPLLENYELTETAGRFRVYRPKP
jgi:hypothetical protein